MKVAKQEWVRIGDAARITGIPVSTLRRWAKAGRIRSAQLGGERTWLFLYLPSLSPPAAAAGSPTRIRPSPQRSRSETSLRESASR